MPAGDIDALWNAEDPNAKGQELFMNFIQAESQSKKEDLNKWDDCESRFEPSELRWISNSLVNNLIFCRTKLNVEDEGVCSQLLQILWEVLDLFGDRQDLEAKMADRYRHMQECLKRMYEDKQLTVDQIKMVLEYARQDVFGHMHLYMACIGMQKQQVQVKEINLFQEMP